MLISKNLFFCASLLLVSCDGLFNPDKDKATVDLVSPNGNEIMFFNSSNEIQYNASSPVLAELYRGETLLTVDTLGASDEGGTWNPDLYDFAPKGSDLDYLGGGYTLCLTSMDDKDVSDESETTFSMAAPFFIDASEEDYNWRLNYGMSQENGLFYSIDTIFWAEAWSGFLNTSGEWDSYHGDFSYSIDVTHIPETAVDTYEGVNMLISTHISSDQAVFDWDNYYSHYFATGLNGNFGYIRQLWQAGISTWVVSDTYYEPAIQNSGGKGRYTVTYKNQTLEFYFNDMLLASYPFDCVLSTFGFCGYGYETYQFDNFTFYGDPESEGLIFGIE